MILVARKAFLLLSGSERRRLARLLAVMTITAIIEVVGVASIMPFMAVVARPDIVTGTGFLAQVYESLQFESKEAFLLATGLGSLLALVVANSLSALTNWLIYRFTYLHAHELATRLLHRYLCQPYAFHLGQNTAVLAKNIFSEVERINVGVLIPGLQLISKLAVVTVLIVLLVALDPLLATIVASVSAGAYGLVYIFVRRKLNVSGRASSAANEECYRVASEALAGIKEIKLAGHEEQFLRRFAAPSLRRAKNAIVAQAISGLPRYALETIAFGGILIITLYLLATRNQMYEVIPTVALYAFAGYRLMPALQQIYSAVTLVRFHGVALDLLYDDLWPALANPLSVKTEPARFAREIGLDDVWFAYPGREDSVLKGVTMRIAANTTVALTGPSGAGKSTLIDIVLGLFTPTAGACRIDGATLTGSAMRAWQRDIGYVPQHIYLSDDSLAGNIAFGVLPEEIDRAAIERSARVARLHDFACALPQGYDTPVGERGVRLSGGQRQRVGIARALYVDPRVLVLDEATSALDGVTEEAIMEAIQLLAHKKTIIIIAHRLSTVQACDIIHLMDSGRIVASGTYSDLIERSEAFRALARTSELA